MITVRLLSWGRSGQSQPDGSIVTQPVAPDGMDGAEPPRQRQQADRRTYSATGAASLALAVGRGTALRAAAMVHCDLLMGYGA